MSNKPREFWIDHLNAKSEVTPWVDNPVKYKKYFCVDLPGGFWPDRALHLIEYSAYEKAVKAAQTFQRLTICYRVGSQPSERLLTELEKAREFLGA